MKYIFIVNPHAGTEDNEANIRAQLEALPQKEDCEIYLTKAVGDATDYVKNYLAENPGEKVRFIACGGDGTVNEVFNGAVGHDNACVTCYPCGSGNDFVKVFGGAEKFMDVEAILTAEEKKIDLLKVGDRYANNVVNFGFDTTVAITINKQRDKTGHGGKSAYTKGIVTALLTAMKNKCKVRADGKVLNPDGRCLLCTVANGQYVGGSFKCAPRAKVDDGWIEVCMIKPISRLRFVKILGTYTEGKHLDDPAMQDIVVYRQAKKVEVVAPEGFAYSLDGEVIFENKFTVEMAEGAVNFAYPE
ncbi:MAG: diacylglycerol kinase family lipid kinase [Ruminococcaceae bacterium]|nr:diacylglycerol kinase family lipid kinase [Oscillospiraceae bacterium]